MTVSHPLDFDDFCDVLAMELELPTLDNCRE